MADKNKVKFGIKKAYYVPYDEDKKTYGTPIPLPGAKSFSLTAEGDETSFYADDIVYYTSNANAGYSGDFEIAMATEGVCTDLLGQEFDDNGVLIEGSDDKQKTFALLYEIDGDVQKRRFCFYNCTLSRPDTEANSKEDTVEPDTDTLSVRMVSREFPWGDGGDTKNVIKASVTNDTTTKATFDSWYTKVYTPTKAAA